MAKNTPNNDHNDNNNDGINLENEFRLIFRTMAAFGLYFTPKTWCKDADGSSISSGTLLQRMYCHFIQLLLFGSTVRSVTGIWYVEQRFVAMQLVQSMWLFLCAINSFIWYYICTTDKLPALFDLWQTHCQSSHESQHFETSLSTDCVRRRKRIIFGISIYYIISNTLFCSFMRFSPFEEMRNDTIYMVAPRVEPFIVGEILTQVAFLYACASYALPFAFLVFCCLLITKQFSQFTTKFHQCIANEGAFTGSITSLRRQHQYLSKVVFVLDDGFSFYLAVTVGGIIVFECILMYELVIAQSFTTFFMTFICVFWICMTCLTFGGIGMVVASVPEKVSKIHFHQQLRKVKRQLV